ncbi:hypothetical protein [Actinoplanes sp. L3-i22]|uniref:hypothetical protein n=1 Tax=Actinoplanes sp. L3-i22 TaxID=2836373 RepID=UPI001C749F75|nr:hypothetical protein [Actinoplanes sp. L3-i22]BCY08799.1 hypothetical protein L3i22_038870 [Actinoplanes sp. L3-i22]
MRPEAIHRIHEYAESVGKLASEPAAETPQHTERTDATGRVIVVLAGDGLPTEIRVRDDWPQDATADPYDDAADSGSEG